MPGRTRHHSGAPSLSRSPRERDRCSVRFTAEDPRGSARRDRVQGRRRLPVDCQRGATFPRPAGAGARDQGPERVRRASARHRWLDDRRGHDQRPGQVRTAGARSLLAGDGVLRAGDRQLPDPVDHEPVELHREPRRPAPGRGRAERPHRACQRRAHGSEPGADRPCPDGRVSARHQYQEGRLSGRGRHRNAARRAAGTAVRGQGPPGGRLGADARGGAAGAAEGAAASGGRSPARRRRGVPADHARRRGT